MSYTSIKDFISEARSAFSFLSSELEYKEMGAIVEGDTCAITWKSIDVIFTIGISPNGFEPYFHIKFADNSVDYSKAEFGFSDLINLTSMQPDAPLSAENKQSYPHFVAEYIRKNCLAVLRGERQVFERMMRIRDSHRLDSEKMERDEGFRQTAKQQIQQRNYSGALQSLLNVSKKSKYDFTKISWLKKIINA